MFDDLWLRFKKTVESTNPLHRVQIFDSGCSTLKNFIQNQMRLERGMFFYIDADVTPANRVAVILIRNCNIFF